MAAYRGTMTLVPWIVSVLSMLVPSHSWIKRASSANTRDQIDPERDFIFTFLLVIYSKHCINTKENVHEQLGASLVQYLDLGRKNIRSTNKTNGSSVYLTFLPFPAESI